MLLIRCVCFLSRVLHFTYMYTSSSFANFLFPIYRIAFMQGSLSDERNVRLSVRSSDRLSVKRVNCEKPKKNLCENFYTLKKVRSHIFMTRRTVGGGFFLPELLGQTFPVGAKKPTFNQYFLVAPQP